MNFYLRLAVAACLVLSLFSTIPKTEASKILAMPYHHKSHVGIFSKFTQSLIKAGHEVWMLTLQKYESTVKKSGAHPILFTVTDDADFNFILDDIMRKNPSGEGSTDAIMTDTFGTFGKYCDQLMTNKAVMKTVKDVKFDLAVIDGTICSVCTYMLPYINNIKYITIHGFQVTAWDAGVTGMPSIEPEIATVFSNKMSFWERLENLEVWQHTVQNPYSEAYSAPHMAKYAGNKPHVTFSDLVRRSEMFLMNFEIFCLDYPRVSAPHYQFLGATTASEAKPLPKDLEEFVNGAKHGVVVMSLGTMKSFQYVWLIIQDKIFEAFGRLEQRVIVQYALPDKPKNIPANVKILEWLPQNDILGHPNTKLFVTHGGNNGQNEAVFHGVPSLVIPVSIDQPYAGVRVETHGYGKHVKDKKTITATELHEMMHEIIYNETYSRNIKKCSAIIRSMPSAMDNFVFWVNHILQFGGDHLKPPSLQGMPMYQVLMLDIVAYRVLQGLAVIHGTFFVLYFAYKKLCSGGKTKTE